MQTQKGTVYFFTGLAGAGKTTLGGLFYKRQKAQRNDIVLLDGDQLRRLSFHKKSGYTTEERLRGSYYNFEMCHMLAEQGVDVVLCSISMYHAARSWARNHIENYKEIYVKAAWETLCQRDQKGLYSGKTDEECREIVGVQLEMEEPKHPDLVVENDGAVSAQDRVNQIFYLHQK